MSGKAGSRGAARVVVVPAGAPLSTSPEGERAETLASIRSRLLAYFAPELMVADPATVRLAIVRVASDLVAADVWFGAIARRGGRAWLRVLDGLAGALDLVGDRRDELGVVAAGDDGAAVRAGLLFDLSSAVDRALLAVDMIHPAREAERVASLVARADAHAVALALSAVELSARGIVEWTVSDVRLWRVIDAALSRIGGRATIELPVLDRPLDAERERDPLEAVIDAIASALDDAPRTVPIRSALGDLRQDAPDQAPGAADVEVRSATGIEAQGRAVADAVFRAIAAGAAPDDVVVALASNDETSALEIVRALEDAGVLAVDARRHRGRRSNLTAVAHLALEVAAHGSPRKEVALLLRSSYVNVRSDEERHPDAPAPSALEVARALWETVTRRGADSAHRLEATVAASSVREERDARALARVALRVGSSLAEVAAGRTRREHVERARALFRELGLARACDANAGLANDVVGQNLLDLEARARDRAAWSSLEDSLSAYEEALLHLGMADVEASLETFRHELAWIDARLPDPVAYGRGAVRVVSLAELSGQESALVVLADADAEAWPDGRAHGELVPAELEDRLKEASDPAFLPLARAGPHQVLARLALGTSRARRVVFTYVSRDEEGGGRSPASVVARLARRTETTTWRSSAVVSHPLSEREWTLAEFAREPDVAFSRLPDVARRALLERQRAAAFGAAIQEVHPIASTLPTGDKFAAILADETGGGKRPLSASAVDRLASCVFQGFVSEVLRPKRVREVHDIADPRQVGERVHAALDAAFRTTATLWGARPRDAERIVHVGLAAAERALGDEWAASPLGRTVTDQALAAVRAVLAWSLADEEWDFAHGEQPFGEGAREGGWETLVLARGGIRVELRGRIDRVDVAHLSGAVRVIDYKPKETSAHKHTAAFGTTKFQLALYARSAEQALGRAKSEGLYLPTQRLRPGGAPKKHAEQWALAHEQVEGVARFERSVLELVAAVREGRIGVHPYSAASCETCEYDGVCRKPRFAVTMPASDVSEEDDS